jgi:hypothetical protein
LYSHLEFGKPSENSSMSSWDQVDNQIISLMLNSIEPHTGSSCLYLPTAKAIWDHLQHMYSDTENITRIYEVCKQYFVLKQGNQTVDEYYNQVVTICKERDMYQPLSTNLKKMEKQHQDVDVVWFLLGLKPEYEFVPAHVLSGFNSPLLPEVFSRLHRATISDHSSLLSMKRNGDGHIGGRGPRKCTHYGRTNYLVDFCWDLHGTPFGFAN